MLVNRNIVFKNNPIATVIKNYIDKKSGKVSESRREIQRRFFGLDWKDQKKILLAFLDSSPSDRNWAYTRVLDYWDPSFEPKMKELWETYHEYRCSWAVIRYFPQDYIIEHLSEFTDERDYYFISLRLAQDKDYVIDRTKLSNNDYLALLCHTERGISDEDARDTLFGIIHDCCLESPFMTRVERVGGGLRRNVISPANYRKVRLAVYYLQKLDKYDVVEQFQQWDESVKKAIYDSPEFKSIDRNDFDFDFEYDHRRIEVANIYAFEALGEKYKQPSDPTVEQMKQSLGQRADWYGKQEKPSVQHMFHGLAPDIEGVEYDEEEQSPF